MTNSFHHHPRGKRRLHAYIRIHTHTHGTHICNSTHTYTCTHTEKQTFFVCLFISRSVNEVVGGHGEHIVALACNDTLLVYMCVCVSVCGV